MSEAAEDANIEAGEVVEAPEANAAPQQDAEPQLTAEDRALAMGWTPKAQFKGDPERWVDAETFVKRGEEFLPFLKANNKRLEQALERANAKMEGLEKAVSKSIEHISRADQRAYARARADLEAELEQAAAAGDTEGVKAVTKDIVNLEKEIGEGKAEEKPADVPEFAAFKDENAAWYGKDKALSAAFDALCRDVFEEGYTSPKAGLKEAMSRLKDSFPEKFAKPVNPNRSAPAAVEGAGAPARRGGKTYADLPPEAKKMCDEFVRDIKGFTRDKFVKDYKWD